MTTKKGKKRKFLLQSGLPEREKPKDKAEAAREILLDPFAPVMLPGAYHFAFGMIFVLAGIGASLFPVLNVLELGPLYDLIIIYLMCFILMVPVYLVTYGKLGALKILRSYVLSPMISYAVFFYTRTNLSSKDAKVILIGAAFSIAAFFLLSTISCRAAVHLKVINRQRIKQMKRDGTYKTNLLISRRRWLGQKRIEGDNEIAISLLDEPVPPV